MIIRALGFYFNARLGNGCRKLTLRQSLSKPAYEDNAVAIPILQIRFYDTILRPVRAHCALHLAEKYMFNAHHHDYLTEELENFPIVKLKYTYDEALNWAREGIGYKNELSRDDKGRLLAITAHLILKCQPYCILELEKLIDEYDSLNFDLSHIYYDNIQQSKISLAHIKDTLGYKANILKIV